jgi:3-oxocholest-4-en-26-oyl-CoA dehydrogenase alpha subunit
VVSAALDLQMRWQAQGRAPQVEGSMRKVFWSESAQRHYSDSLDILGAEGVLARAQRTPRSAENFELDFRAAVVTTVYGGASEILREIIAERRRVAPQPAWQLTGTSARSSPFGRG